MKVVTEFPSFVLKKAIQTQGALTAEGKTPDEIQASIGETFKLEAEKLTHFMRAIEVAKANQEDLKRVLVVAVGEGERVPAKAVAVEANHYVPESYVSQIPKPAASKGKGGGKGGRGGKGGGRGDNRGEKSSPWGLSPEEKAAKAAKSLANATAPKQIANATAPKQK